MKLNIIVIIVSSRVLSAPLTPQSCVSHELRQVREAVVTREQVPFTDLLAMGHGGEDEGRREEARRLGVKW